MSFLGTLGKIANVGSAIGIPGFGAASAALGFADGGGSGSAGSCPGQVSTAAVQYMLGRATQAEKDYLSQAWSRSVKSMAIPWGDPWKLAQQARGGGGCKISGDDSYWVNAFNLVMARYPMPASSAAAAVPPVVAGALPAASSSTAAPVYVASSGGGGGLGLPLVLVAVVVIAAVGFYLVRRK